MVKNGVGAHSGTSLIPIVFLANFIKIRIEKGKRVAAQMRNSIFFPLLIGANILPGIIASSINHALGISSVIVYLDGNPYNITPFLNEHPGGSLVLKMANGQEIREFLLGHKYMLGRCHQHHNAFDVLSQYEMDENDDGNVAVAPTKSTTQQTTRQKTTSLAHTKKTLPPTMSTQSPKKVANTQKPATTAQRATTTTSPWPFFDGGQFPDVNWNGYPPFFDRPPPDMWQQQFPAMPNYPMPQEQEYPLSES